MSPSSRSEALDQAEDYLICTGVTTQGDILDEEVVQRLFSLPGIVTESDPSAIDDVTLCTQREARQEAIRRQISKRNADFFEIEVEKLDSWADDLKVGLERRFRNSTGRSRRRERPPLQRSPWKRLAGQKQIKAIEAERGKRRRALFDAQDEIDRRREQLINEIEGKLQQKASSQQLFSVRWQVR